MGQDEWLELTAKLSIYSSVLIVIYFLAHAFVRIVRMPNPPWREWKKAKNRAVEVYKRPVELSFVLKLKEDSTQQPDRVTFHLKTNRRAVIKLFWGVSVTYVFELMRSSWKDFDKAVSELEELKVLRVGEKREESRDRDKEDRGDSEERAAGDNDDMIRVKSKSGSKRPARSLKDACHAVVDYPLPETEDGTFDDVISVSPPPTLKWKDLTNKYRYPLAIVVYQPETSSDDNDNESNSDDLDEIRGLFTLLHVKSDTFPLPTTVLAHYIKMDNANANTFLLKPLYLVEDDTLLDDESNAEETNGSKNATGHSSTTTSSQNILNSFPGVSCTVCQTLPVSRAILPCGHVCLCVQCFEKVERCPICRGEMQYFFRTRDEDYATEQNSEDTNNEVARSRSWFECFEDWNNWVNYWLGFRD